MIRWKMNLDKQNRSSLCVCLTFQLMMNDVREVGLFTPPEDPQLLGIRFDFASPYTQQIGLHAAHEAAQNRVILGRGRDDWPVLAAAAEVVATPLNACQLRLGEKRITMKSLQLELVH